MNFKFSKYEKVKFYYTSISTIQSSIFYFIQICISHIFWSRKIMRPCVIKWSEIFNKASSSYYREYLVQDFLVRIDIYLQKHSSRTFITTFLSFLFPIFLIYKMLNKCQTFTSSYSSYFAFILFVYRTPFVILSISNLIEKKKEKPVMFSSRLRRT